MTSSVSLPARVRKAIDPKTRTIDLGELYPPLRVYCPIYQMRPGISPPQAYFLLLDNEEAFYGGAVGGGKSAALLMGALQYVDIPGYRALILRRTFAMLTKGDALIPLSHEWLAGTDAKWNEQKHRWTFPSGATLEFGHVENETNKFDYQGAAFHFVGFDELTQFSDTIYEYIAFSRQRRRTDMAELGVPVRVRATGNPGGVGHGWVKKRFLERRPDGVAFVPAKVRDNPGLDADDYEQRLRKLNPVLARQLLEGDWDVFEGMAFPWDSKLHEVPGFPVPAEWERFESLDHGTSNPTAVLAWAVDHDGNLIVFDSYYEQNRLASQHADAILGKRAGWWPKDAAPVCYADPSIWNKIGHQTKLGEPASIATEYLEHGLVGLSRANNDRKAGRLRVAELLLPDPERSFPDWHPRRGESGSPGMFVFERCRELCEQLASAPLMPIDSGLDGAGEVVDPKWEGPAGHAVAACRYGAMSRPEPSERPKRWEPDPRRRMLARIVEREREEDELRDGYGYVEEAYG